VLHEQDHQCCDDVKIDEYWDGNLLQNTHLLKKWNVTVSQWKMSPCYNIGFILVNGGMEF
jgi:hypothetical protein